MSFIEQLDPTKKTAFFTTLNKVGVPEFATALAAMDWQIIASGGTAKAISDAGVSVMDVAKITGQAASAGHLVVTISGAVALMVLAKNDPNGQAELDQRRWPSIDLVCVDLYDLPGTMKNPDVTWEMGAANSDVGGHLWLRAAAKAALRGCIVTYDLADRAEILSCLRGNTVDREFCRRLAGKALRFASEYDRAFAAFLLGEGDMVSL